MSLTPLRCSVAREVVMQVCCVLVCVHDSVRMSVCVCACVSADFG